MRHLGFLFRFACNCLPGILTEKAGRLCRLRFSCFARLNRSCAVLYPHFAKDYFGPDSTRSLYMVDRQHIWKSNRGLADNHGQSHGKVWRNCLSPTRVGYRKSDRLLFLNMFKNSSRPKHVGPRSYWSYEGPLKVFLSRLPSGDFVYPLELSLSYTLSSSVRR